MEIRRLKENLSGKNYESEQLSSRINEMTQKLAQMKDFEKKNYEYEDKVVLATQ